jgi:hypothetical protein
MARLQAMAGPTAAQWLSVAVAKREVPGGKVSSFVTPTTVTVKVTVEIYGCHTVYWLIYAVCTLYTVRSVKLA